MFKGLDRINNPKDKKTFIEKVNVFIRLIDLFALKNNLICNKKNVNVNKDTSLRLQELGIINLNIEQNHEILNKLLKKDLYSEFISAINFNIQYKTKIGKLLDKIDPSKRKLIQEKEKHENKPKVVDFFCGAGGLSLGFVQAGFQIDLANDNEDVCIESYRYNHPEIADNRIIHGDIRKIVNHLEEYMINDIDVVVGGPPCQGFSSANQQRIIDDSRNELYKFFIQSIEKIGPKFVVMENVKGMLPYAEQVKEDFQNISIKNGKKSISYNLEYKVLVSDDFGVAQKRPRLIFIAIRNDISTLNDLTPMNLFDDIEKDTSNVKKHILKDALEHIKPLDAPRIKNMTEVDDEITGKKIDINQFEGNENSYLKLINQRKIIEYVFNHKARYANDINYEIYSTLEQGEDGTSEKIKHIMPYQHRNHIFKDKYFKLDENKPSRTITAHLRMDCHSHIHPRQTRSITPREAARIQSFPDDYFFMGPYLKTYMQIGNAVPPRMANFIARVLKKFLN